MTTLKQAIAENKLDQFIKEHEADDAGDQDALERTIEAMVRKSKEAPATSSQADDES